MKDVERAAYYVDTKLVSLQFCNAWSTSTL